MSAERLVQVLNLSDEALKDQAELRSALAVRLGFAGGEPRDVVALTRAAIDAQPDGDVAEPLPVRTRQANPRSIERSIVPTPDFVEDVVRRLARGAPIAFTVTMDEAISTGLGIAPRRVITLSGEHAIFGAVRDFLDFGPIVVVNDGEGDAWAAATVEHQRLDAAERDAFPVPVDVVRRLGADGVVSLYIRGGKPFEYASKREAVADAHAIARDPQSRGFIAVPHQDAAGFGIGAIRRRFGLNGEALPADEDRLAEGVRRALRTFAACGSPAFAKALSVMTDPGWFPKFEAGGLARTLTRLTHLASHEPEAARRVQQGAAVAPALLEVKEVRRRLAEGTAPAAALVDWLADPGADIEGVIGSKEPDVVEAARHLAKTPGLPRMLSDVLTAIRPVATESVSIEALVGMALALAVVGKRNPHLKPRTAQESTALTQCWRPYAALDRSYPPDETQIARFAASRIRDGRLEPNGPYASEVWRWAFDEIGWMAIGEPRLAQARDRMRYVDVLFTSAAIRMHGAPGARSITNAWHPLVDAHFYEREAILSQMRFSNQSSREAALAERRTRLAMPHFETDGVAITPVSRVEDLRRIGREMQNCAGAYAAPVTRGDSFLLSLESAGERSLVELDFRTGTFEVKQHEIERQKKPSRRHAAAIEAYLAAVNADGPLKRRIGEVLDEVDQFDARLTVLTHRELKAHPAIEAELADLVRRSFCKLFLPDWMADAAPDEILDYADEIARIEHLTPGGRGAVVALRNRSGAQPTERAAPAP